MSVSRQRVRLALLRAFAALSSPLRPRGAGRFTPAAPPCPDGVVLRQGRRPRILLLRPDHMGDLLFATPALRALRQALPNAHLTCMVGPWGKGVLEHNPHVDEIIVCEFPGFSRKPKTSTLAPYHELHRQATRLRAEHLDAAIVLRFDHWWGALLAYLAGIPHRVGYAIPECEPFLTQALPYIGQRHEVVQNLALVEQVIHDHGGNGFPGESRMSKAHEECLALPLEFPVLAEDQEHVIRYLAEWGVTSGESLVAIHPGAGAAVKLWRLEAWAEVADAIARHWGARIVISGSRDELDLAWAIYAHMDCEPIITAGKTSLGQLAALFQRCRLVIGPDCGPLHLAVAVGTPTVHLFGPVDPRKFGPWGPAEKHTVLVAQRECIPCNRLDYSAAELADHPCVREITVQSVLEAAKKLLGRKDENPDFC